MDWKKLKKNKHFQYGAPFLIMVLGGSFGLKFYSQLRYDVQKERHIVTRTKELRDRIGPIREKTIEEVYEEDVKNLDIDNWKNVRGPRPWENDNTEYRDLIERRAKESKDQWIFKK